MKSEKERLEAQKREQKIAAASPEEIQQLKDYMNELIEAAFVKSGLPPPAAATYKRVFQQCLIKDEKRKTDCEISKKAAEDSLNFSMYAIMADIDLDIYRMVMRQPKLAGQGKITLVPDSPLQVYRGILFTVKKSTYAPGNPSDRYTIETPLNSEETENKDIFKAKAKTAFTSMKAAIDKLLAQPAGNYVVTVPKLQITRPKGAPPQITAHASEKIELHAADLKTAQNIAYFYQAQPKFKLKAKIASTQEKSISARKNQSTKNRPVARQR